MARSYGELFLPEYREISETERKRRKALDEDKEVARWVNNFVNSALGPHWEVEYPDGVKLEVFGLGDHPPGTLHDAAGCEGRGCPIHHASAHLLRTWPLLWSRLLRTMYRACPHGKLLVDPDHAAYVPIHAVTVALGEEFKHDTAAYLYDCHIIHDGCKECGIQRKEGTFEYVRS